MPAFTDSLDDAQIAELAAYMRQRFAPGKPPWRDLEREVARVRARAHEPLTHAVTARDPAPASTHPHRHVRRRTAASPGREAPQAAV